MAIQSSRAAGVRMGKDKAVRRGTAQKRTYVQAAAQWQAWHKTGCDSSHGVQEKSRARKYPKNTKSKSLAVRKGRAKNMERATVVRKAEQTDVLAYKKRRRHGNALGAPTASATVWGRAVPRKSDTIRPLGASARPPFPPLSAGGFFARLRQARLLAAQ